MQTQQLAPAAARDDVLDNPILQRVLPGSVENLVATWSEERGLFPFSSRLSAEGVTNDYDHPIAARYTINSLLGLQEAATAGLVDSTLVGDMTARFLDLHRARIVSVADLGLTLNLLAKRAEPELDEWSEKLAAATATPIAKLNVQDIAWALWGASDAGREDIARPMLQALRDELTDPATGLPRHSVRWYRRQLVSFGGLVYYLRALDAASSFLQDEWAEAAFRAGVARALELQGPHGEWPWLLNVSSGRPVDAYPVFAVHQDSMAMLFLLPAFDRGLPGTDDAIKRSLAWCDGDNELGTPMYVDAPFFFAYRSIERPERAQRMRRYVRSLTRSRPEFGAGTVRLNDECRSYHLGWILYAWSPRRAAPERTA